MDAFTEQYQDRIDGSYDCVDRIVLNVGGFQQARTDGAMHLDRSADHGLRNFVHLNGTSLSWYHSGAWFSPRPPRLCGEFHAVGSRWRLESAIRLADKVRFTAEARRPPREPARFDSGVRLAGSGGREN